MCLQSRVVPATAVTKITSLYLHQAAMPNRRKPGKMQEKKLNVSASFTMPFPHAALLHIGRVPRRGPGCLSFRAAGRTGHRPGICGSRTLAPPAGLWPRRAHEDRNRPRALLLRNPSREDHRIADCRNTGKSRLAELERVVAGGDGRPGKTQAGGISASRTR